MEESAQLRSDDQWPTSILIFNFNTIIAIGHQILSPQKLVPRYEPLMCRDRIIPVQHSQYHGCWCPGSLWRQDISTHASN